MGRITTYLLTAFAAILWGANFNLAKPVVAEMHPYVAGATRYLMAATIMLLVTQYRRECIPLRHLKWSAPWPSLQRPCSAVSTSYCPVGMQGVHC